jgi:SNF2 family DNA or RNA helicase
VGTFQLLATGVTLTAARHAVIFDAEWLARNEEQGIHRISCITQTEPTKTIKLVNSDSKLDMAIYDRQGARRQMLELVQGVGD